MTALEALNLAAPIADTYMSVEERLLVRIARQLTLNDDHQLNEASKWQIKQLAKHGLLRQDAHKIIAAGTKGVPNDVAETVRQAIESTLAEDGLAEMRSSGSFAESAAAAVKHYRAQARDVYNQVNTVMQYKADSTFVRAVNAVAEKWTAEQRRAQLEIADKQGVLDILNSNTAAVVSGAESRTRAVRTTIHEMAQRGIPAFVDKSGREWSPEAYVNMDIRATVKNTALEARFSTMDSLGQDVFEVSSHPGSRPKCRPWQGKLISRSGRTTEITDINGRRHKVIPLSQTSFGEPDGLFGINCGHRPRGVSDGLFRKSAVEYDDEEDKELYDKVCKQRELERRVRKSKTEADMLEAAGDTEGAKQVRQRAAEQNKQLKAYCEGAGLKYRTDRVRTYGSVKPDTDSARRAAMAAEMNKPQPTLGPQAISAASSFTPAKTVQEAQEYAGKFIEQRLGDKTFKGAADFKGVSVENANDINRALSDVFEQYDIPKISGIKAIDPTSAKGKKIFSSADAVMAYSPVEHGVYMNKAVLKNPEALAAYNRQAQEAWDTVMSNIDGLSGAQREIAMRYKQAGRSLVGDGSAHDYFVHEMGHHIQWEAFDAKTNNAIGSRMSEYAGKISGYATASKSEYFAESFAAFKKGEFDKLDPEFVSFMRGKALDKSAGSGIIKARRLAQEKKFNYRDYDEVIDEKSVDDLKTFVADKMGISHISGIDKLKNGRQAHELLSKVEELSVQYGKRFTRVSLFDYGDEITAAETVGRELRLNVQYLNRPGAFQAVLDEWNESGHIPKGCNNVAYVAKHEYSHLLTQDIIDEPHSKIVSAVRRAVKDGCEKVSKNGEYDCHEFVADLLSAKTLTKSQQKLKDAIMKILK